MKKKCVIKLLSAVMAVTISLSQGGEVYAAATNSAVTEELEGLHGSGDEDNNSDDPAAGDTGKTGGSAEDADKSGDASTGDTKKSDDPATGDKNQPGGSDGKTTDQDGEPTGEGTDENGESAEEGTEPADDAAEGASSEELAETEAETDLENGEGTSKKSEELPEGIGELPEDFKLSSEDKEIKAKAISHDTLGAFEDLKEGRDYVENEVIAVTETRQEAEEIAEIYSGELVEYSNAVATISLENSPLTVEEALKYALDEDLGLPYVGPNYKSYIIEPAQEDNSAELGGSAASYITDVPSGNGFADWWGDLYSDPLLKHDNQYGIYQWHHKMMNTYSAWGVTTGDKDIVVAVIDTGVNTSHSDLDANIKNVNTGMPASPDQPGHGTHVAGIIAGELNGALGAGIAPKVSILPLKVSSTIEIPDAEVIKALNAVSGYPNGSR